ncbi:MAG: HAD family phosphatase [Candidatus Micrarchaeaceae archaeon]
MAVKGILFDLGGTLIDYTNKGSGYYSYLSSISGKSEELVCEVVERHLPAFWKGKMKKIEFERAIARRIGIKASEVRWYEYYAEHMKVRNSMVMLAKKLGESYKVGYLSNIDRSLFFFNLKAFDQGIFAYRFASCFIGYAKPEREIYEYAIKRMGLPADEVVFIDNEYENVIGARRIGIKAILFKSFNMLLRELKGLVKVW